MRQPVRSFRLLATSAQAGVLFTPPTTTRQSGRSSSSTGSTASITRAVCCAVAPAADAEVVVRLGEFEVPEERVGPPGVVVLPRVDQDRLVPRVRECAQDGRHPS
jgi:hypothetical protein